MGQRVKPLMCCSVKQDRGSVVQNERRWFKNLPLSREGKRIKASLPASFYEPHLFVGWKHDKLGKHYSFPPPGWMFCFAFYSTMNNGASLSPSCQRWKAIAKLFAWLIGQCAVCLIHCSVHLSFSVWQKMTLSGASLSGVCSSLFKALPAPGICTVQSW